MVLYRMKIQDNRLCSYGLSCLRMSFDLLCNVSWWKGANSFVSGTWSMVDINYSTKEARVWLVKSKSWACCRQLIITEEPTNLSFGWAVRWNHFDVLLIGTRGMAMTWENFSLEIIPTTSLLHKWTGLSSKLTSVDGFPFAEAIIICCRFVMNLNHLEYLNPRTDRCFPADGKQYWL